MFTNQSHNISERLNKTNHLENSLLTQRRFLNNDGNNDGNDDGNNESKTKCFPTAKDSLLKYAKEGNLHSFLVLHLLIHIYNP